MLWDEYWDSMKKEWFKIEVLQDYSGEDMGPSLEAWLQGHREKAIELIKSEPYKDWIKHCQQTLKRGVKLTRAHIVQRPYSEYIEWELEHYKHVNISKCGENVFLVNAEEVANLDIPSGDMMFFDDTKAVINQYYDNGKVISSTFYDESDDISRFISLREAIRQKMKSYRF